MRPEKYGVDVLWRTREGWAGIQRKELGDLLASVRDGRLGRQLREMAQLKFAMVVVEGRPRFSMDGELIGSERHGQNGRPWTRKQLKGVMWSIQNRGVWVDGTENLAETVDLVQMFADWTRKPTHTGLEGRPGPVGDGWGKAGVRDWQHHILMGLPGVGGELATRILDDAGMVLGLVDGGREKLLGIRGIGPKKVEEICRITM